MDLSFQEKKQFVNPLHGSKVTTILLIHENSDVFFKHPVVTKLATSYSPGNAMSSYIIKVKSNPRLS